jgi:hypothetical protein
MVPPERARDALRAVAQTTVYATPVECDRNGLGGAEMLVLLVQQFTVAHNLMPDEFCDCGPRTVRFRPPASATRASLSISHR